ncbi:unnamed protein product [Microthlaspi erraticum]|uniref:Uncharacterized protein n=1 Tax=Microthlaspi erraticum TaxID=1685480 RepID=A0A6D2IXN2_9BRAS|nr:unnamed protein product [Microthlaspi erraticum]
MSNWRRQKPRNNNNHHHYHHRQGTTMTQSSKPPLANCRQSVPAWEKEFCAKIGLVPWSRVLEAKQSMYLYGRVVQWDDSAGEDAFKNAKSRFWAERNGFPCDLTLPDPDVYIDDVDWDAEVDTELILDLERRGPAPVRKEGEEPVVILDALVLPEQYSGVGWGTGWGDAEGINAENVANGKPENSWDDQKRDGWDYGLNLNNNNSFKNEAWGHNNNNNFKNEAWGHNNNNFRNESWGHNNNSFRNEAWGHRNSNGFNQKKVENWNCKDQGRESREWRKRGAVPRGGDRVEDCRWRNGRGRSRGGFQQQSNGWGWTETF